MTIRIGIVAMIIFVASVLSTVNVARPNKRSLAPPKHTPVVKTIKVDDSDQCVETEDMPAETDGTHSDKVEWKIASNSVADFHVIFEKKSPSQHKERYFDKNKKDFTAITNPKNDAEVFKYIISVDLTDGSNKTCDPHVIVSKATGAQ